jgi:hypothetical protein
VTTDRTFSRDEARSMLPALNERLPRLREARVALIEASHRIEDAVAADGGGVAGSDALQAQFTLRAELTWLADEGILLRDPGSGLIDFPGVVDGEPVYLCWRLGEDDVGFYHATNVGYSGRKPL